MNCNDRIMRKKDIVSPNTGKVGLALSKTQAEFTSFEVNSQAYSFNYLDLAGILKIALPIMGKHGLSLYQNSWVEVQDDQPWVFVKTRLSCEDEYFEDTMSFPMMSPRKGLTEDLMLLGSTMSYLRRYSVQMALGITGSEKSVEEIVDNEARPNPNAVGLK